MRKILICLMLALGLVISPVSAKKKKAMVTLKVIGIHKTFYNKKLSYKKGETAYTLLKRSKLKLKTKGFGPFLYVSSINGLAEKTHGNLSGWMYKVGKKAPNIGANAYKLKANTKVTWYYVNY